PRACTPRPTLKDNTEAMPGSRTPLSKFEEVRAVRITREVVTVLNTQMAMGRETASALDMLRDSVRDVSRDWVCGAWGFVDKRGVGAGTGARTSPTIVAKMTAATENRQVTAKGTVTTRSPGRVKASRPDAIGPSAKPLVNAIPAEVTPCAPRRRPPTLCPH